MFLHMRRFTYYTEEVGSQVNACGRSVMLGNEDAKPCRRCNKMPKDDNTLF